MPAADVCSASSVQNERLLQVQDRRVSKTNCDVNCCLTRFRNVNFLRNFYGSLSQVRQKGVPTISLFAKHFHVLACTGANVKTNPKCKGQPCVDCSVRSSGRKSLRKVKSHMMRTRPTISLDGNRYRTACFSCTYVTYSSSWLPRVALNPS